MMEKTKILEFEKFLKQQQTDFCLRYSKDRDIFVVTTNFKDKKIFAKAVTDFFLKEELFNLAFLFQENNDQVLMKNFEIKKNQLERRELEMGSELEKSIFETVRLLKAIKNGENQKLSNFVFLDPITETLKELTEIGIDRENELFVVDIHKILRSLKELELDSSTLLRLLEHLVDLSKKMM